MTPTSDWITGRRPTAADGDRKGDVKVRDSYIYLHWSMVREAEHWKRCAGWRPSAAVTPTNDWITDRLPTEDDGDSKEEVKVRCKYIDYVHWSCVDEATPWQHCGDWQPPTAPAPEPTKPALEVVTVLPNGAFELLPPELSTPTPRKFASLTRTVNLFGQTTIDAIDDDGVAWWMSLAEGDSESEWHQLLPLPGREVVG